MILLGVAVVLLVKLFLFRFCFVCLVICWFEFAMYFGLGCRSGGAG